MDATAKEHDISYRYHPKTKDRWLSNNILQEEAWDGVITVDADLSKRALSLAATGGMWLKRKQGIGLDIKPGFSSSSPYPFRMLTTILAMISLLSAVRNSSVVVF